VVHVWPAEYLTELTTLVYSDVVFLMEKAFMHQVKRLATISTIVLATITIPPANAGEIEASINFTSKTGIGRSIGSISAQDTEYGLLLTPALSGLVPGVHAFHVHTNPDCSPAEKDGKLVPGLAAGGHYDPQNTGHHDGSHRHGLGDLPLGDLPPLVVNSEGNATAPVLAPWLTTEDLQGRSLIIHLHGHNHADRSLPLGGEAPRLACGVFE